MRTWTLVVSVCAHALAIGAFIVVPLFATADLPDPRRPLTFEAITPIVTPDIPVAPRSQPSQPSAVTQAIPVTEPPALLPETPAAVPDVPPDLVAPGGTGVP